MEPEKLEQRYWDYLETLSLMDLRVLGRNAGLSNATTLVKEKLIEELVGVYTNKVEPKPRDNRGAPPKQTYIDPKITEALYRIRLDSLYEGKEECVFRVSSPNPEKREYNMKVHSGVLELQADGTGLLRVNNCEPTEGKDVFLPAPAVRALKLREGDYVSCSVQPISGADAPVIDELMSVNECLPGRYEGRSQFFEMTAQYAQERIDLTLEEKSLSLRVLNLFVPIGKGQRTLLIAPPGAGRTTLFKEIAHSVRYHHSDLVLISLLIDERPEDLTDFLESAGHSEVYYSSFDQGAEHHVRVARLVMQRVMRLAELGKDVVLLVDSLTKLVRAYSLLAGTPAKTYAEGPDAEALTEVKRFFGTARKLVGEGSVTIIAAVLSETGSRADDMILEEFRGTGNAEIVLSSELARQRIFPAVDLQRSGTKKALWNKQEAEGVYALRAHGFCADNAVLYQAMQKYATNQEFLNHLKDVIK